MKRAKSNIDRDIKDLQTSIKNYIQDFSRYFKQHTSEESNDSHMFGTDGGSMSGIRQEYEEIEEAIHIVFPLSCMSNSTSLAPDVPSSSSSSRGKRAVQLLPRDGAKEGLRIPHSSTRSLQQHCATFVSAQTKTHLSVVAGLNMSLEVLCRGSTMALRTTHGLCGHLLFLQSVFTMRTGLCWESLRVLVLDGIESYIEEPGCTRHDKQSYTSWGTDAVSNSIATLLADLAPSKAVTHVAVSLPCDIHKFTRESLLDNRLIVIIRKKCTYCLTFTVFVVVVDLLGVVQ